MQSIGMRTRSSSRDESVPRVEGGNLALDAEQDHDLQGPGHHLEAGVTLDRDCCGGVGAIIIR